MSKHVKVEGKQDGEITEFKTPPWPKAGPVVREHDSTAKLTQERGAVYGHPRDHFNCTQQMFFIWKEARNKSKQPRTTNIGVNHAVYMILDKLSRLATTIDHEDSWSDIAGYAACAKKILFEE